MNAIAAIAAATSNETTTDQRVPPALGPTMRSSPDFADTPTRCGWC
jgi:hypothetical protein